MHVLSAPEVALGETAYLPFPIYESGSLAAPDSTPTASVYTADALAGPALAASVTVSQINSETGCYVASLDVSQGNGFEPGGTYWLRVAWEVSGSDRVLFIGFRVI